MPPPFFGFVRLFSWVVMQSCAELCRDLGRWRLRRIGGVWTSKAISMRFFGADFRIGSMETRPKIRPKKTHRNGGFSDWEYGYTSAVLNTRRAMGRAGNGHPNRASCSGNGEFSAMYFC